MLGRQAVRGGLGLWRARGGFIRAGEAVRAYASNDPTGEVLKNDDFKKQWKNVAPTLDLPRFPISYMAERPEVPSSMPDKVTLNLVLPYKFEITAKEVDMVIVPASTGQLGVLPAHVPTIIELKPGILSIHEGDDTKKYFVSSGFAFSHANSVLDVVVIEGVPMDQLDPEEIKKGLEEYTQKVTSADTDLEKAEAQIGLDVHSALNSALIG